MAKQRVAIVFEVEDSTVLLSKDDGPKFNIFLEGLSEERQKEIKGMQQSEYAEKLNTAEFWALSCFSMCVRAVAATGAVKEIRRK